MGATGHVVEDRVRADTPESVSLPEPARAQEEEVEKRSRATTPKPALAAEPNSSPLSSASNPFSDDEPENMFSPPSSPPNPQQRPLVSHLKARKPTFSFLNRKRKRDNADSDADMPLSEIGSNATHVRKLLPPPKKQRLTQMRIDLGGEVRKTCKGCGMEYVPSHEEDAALHKIFHGLNIAGVDLGKGFVKEVGALEWLDEGESVVLVDGRSSASIRKRVRKVMDVVKTDLGAVEIEDAQLWGVQEKAELRGKGNMKTAIINTEEGGKVFLYCIGDKCVGLCLAERIRSASRVVSKARDNPKGSLTTEPSITPMLLGISRIWTSKSHRRKGIALTLLNKACSHYFYGIQVPKKMVAFSQPTQNGTQLAERWFDLGKAKSDDADGWHVYTEGK